MRPGAAHPRATADRPGSNRAQQCSWAQNCHRQRPAPVRHPKPRRRRRDTLTLPPVTGRARVYWTYDEPTERRRATCRAGRTAGWSRCCRAHRVSATRGQARSQRRRWTRQAVPNVGRRLPTGDGTARSRRCRTRGLDQALVGRAEPRGAAARDRSAASSRRPDLELRLALHRLDRLVSAETLDPPSRAHSGRPDAGSQVAPPAPAGAPGSQAYDQSMEDVPGSISRSQIVKAASRARRWLRGELKIDDPKVDAALEVIFAYRALHAARLVTANNGLRNMIRTEGCRVEVERLKRLPTIVNKLATRWRSTTSAPRYSPSPWSATRALPWAGGSGSGFVHGEGPLRARRHRDFRSSEPHLSHDCRDTDVLKCSDLRQ